MAKYPMSMQPLIVPDEDYLRAVERARMAREAEEQRQLDEAKAQRFLEEREREKAEFCPSV